MKEAVKLRSTTILVFLTSVNSKIKIMVFSIDEKLFYPIDYGMDGSSYRIRQDKEHLAIVTKCDQTISGDM